MTDEKKVDNPGEHQTSSSEVVLPGAERFQWPPPDDWQALERLCWLVWRKEWQDLNAQRNGRPGQEQQGVDVFGKPKGAMGYHGIQCKRKDAVLRTLLTEDEVRQEVENAKHFQPPLEELIIATCAPNDAKLQALARAITIEHEKLGLFRVHVFGWQEISARLAQHGDVVASFYGFAPLSNVGSKSDSEDRSRSEHAELVAGQAQIQKQIASLASTMAAPADGPTHAKLDICRELLESNRHRAALPALEKIYEQEWEGATAALRFRIATNLGAANIGLGQYEKGAELFLKAYEFDHSSEKALANFATGLLILGRDDEAIKASERAIEAYPSGVVAWSAFLNVFSRLRKDSLPPDVPEAIENEPSVLFARADFYANRGDFAKAEDLYRQLIVLPNSPAMAKSRLGEAILAETVGDRFYAGAQYSDSEIVLLSEARDLFYQSWQEVRTTDLAQSALHVVANLCALSTVVGDMPASEVALDEALAISPNHPDLVVWKIRIAAARGDGKTAATFSQRLPSGAAGEYSIAQATAHRAAGNVVKAAEVLETYINADDTGEDSVDARCMFADFVCAADIEHAEARFNSLPHAGEPQVSRATVIFSRALLEAGRDEAARKYLDLARSQITSDSDDRDRLMLADALVDFDEPEQAADLYQKGLTTTTDTPSLRSYCQCLLELDQRRQLRNLLDALPASISQQPAYEFTRASLSIRSGDLTEARAALERYLLAKPDRVHARIMWAQVCVHQQDLVPVKEWLNTVDVRSMQFSLEHLLSIGPLFHAVGRPNEAAETFYEALRRFPQDPRPQIGFCGSVLLKGDSSWVHTSDRVAAPNTAVRLKDSDGRERVFIIEQRPESELLADEIAESSDLATRIMGKKAGEIVVGYSSELGTHESEIVSVDHKFAYVVNETLAAFNTRFPESNGLLGIKLPNSEDPEETLGPFFRALKEQSSHANQVEDTISKCMPIAGIGAMLGCTPVEAWRKIIARGRQRIVVCDGNVEERAAAQLLIGQSDRRFIVDPTCLAELGYLKVLDIVPKVCGRLAVVQSTIGEIQDLLRDLEMRPEGYMTVFERDGQYFRNEVSAKAVATEKDFLNSLLKWVASNCDIVPAIPKSDLKPAMLKALHQALGSGTLDTLLAAQDGAFTLLSDDMNLRRLAKSEFKAEGVWVQAVLMTAVEKNRMGRDHYNRCVVNLTSWRHQFTSIDDQQLFFAAQRGNWKASPEFRALASSLSLKNCEINSLIGVVSRLLNALWKRPPGPSRRQATNLTNAILEAIAPGEAPNNILFFRILQSLASKGRIPPEAWNAIVEWYKKNFLPPLFP